MPGSRARFRAGACRARVQARRQAFRARRQPAPPLLGAARGAGAGRHVGAAVPGLHRRRAAARAVPRRGFGGGGRGPGAGRQGAVAAGRAAEPAARDLRRPARHERLPRGHAQVVCGGGSCWARLRQGASRLLRARARPGPRRRRRADRLHVGHHRPVQGRAAQSRQHDRHVGKLRQRGIRPARRQLAVLPADGLGGRLDVLAQHQPRCRRDLQLSRKPRDRAARPARAGPQRAPCAAPHLGEHADRAAGQDGRRVVAQAARLRVFSALLPSGASCCGATASPFRSAPGSPAGSARCSFTAPCATSWACAMRAGA